MSSLTVPARPAPLPHHCTFPESEWRALAKHWYPIAYSDEVADKPLARTLLDQPLILYRTTGRQVVVARDLCIHRGVPLHLGWQEGDELVCAYHGFRYGADGRCTKVPAQPDLPVPRKLCLETYAAVERGGLIWTCLAPDLAQAATIPAWPELEDPAYLMLHDPPPEWEVTAGRQLENFIDVGHFSWIHTGTFGNRETPEVAPYEVVRTPHGFHVEYPYLAANRSASALGDAPTIQRWMIYDLHLPLACRLTIDLARAAGIASSTRRPPCRGAKPASSFSLRAISTARCPAGSCSTGRTPFSPRTSRSWKASAPRNCRWT